MPQLLDNRVAWQLRLARLNQLGQIVMVVVFRAPFVERLILHFGGNVKLAVAPGDGSIAVKGQRACVLPPKCGQSETRIALRQQGGQGEAARTQRLESTGWADAHRTALRQQHQAGTGRQRDELLRQEFDDVLPTRPRGRGAQRIGVALASA